MTNNNCKRKDEQFIFICSLTFLKACVEKFELVKVGMFVVVAFLFLDL
jgi:hypothetical protein